MNPFVVQWLFDTQARMQNDARYQDFLTEYKTHSQKMQEILTTLPDKEWETATSFLGVCFAMYMWLIELGFVEIK